MSTPKLEFKPEDFHDKTWTFNPIKSVDLKMARTIADLANTRLREMLRNSEEGNEFVMVCYFKDENERLRQALREILALPIGAWRSEHETIAREALGEK